MDAREERLARNEVAFRELNEAIEANVHGKLFGEQSKLVGFVCECGHAECAATVRMHVTRYEAIRRDPQLFLIAVGHEIPDIEDVVEVHEGFSVVRKHDDLAEVVE